MGRRYRCGAATVRLWLPELLLYCKLHKGIYDIYGCRWNKGVVLSIWATASMRN